MAIAKENQSEIAKAETMLQALRVKLQEIRSSVAEQKAEVLEIDRKHIRLQATGDINQMLAVRRRTIAINKTIATLSASEMQCRDRIRSVERYLDTLNKKLEGLRREANSVTEKLAADDLAPEALAGLQTARRRIKMQIDALAGPSRSRPLNSKALNSAALKPLNTKRTTKPLNSKPFNSRSTK
jgi:chromosome segregation ATPase